MKNKIKLSGIIAMVAIIGFSFAACGDGSGTGGGGKAPKITTTTLPGGTVGTSYSHTLKATGDTPITWSIDGSLPAGLSLAGTGVISGTPTTAGTSNFTVKATNAAGNNTKPLSITITAVGDGIAPTITTATLPNGTVGTAYNQTLAATGDTPITWTIGSGTLPTGLNLAGTTGVISGTPTAVGTSNFTVKAANAVGIGTKPFSITIGEQKPPIEGMVWIEPGTFTMGSPTNEPGRDSDETQHQVTLTGFYMGKYPVTQAQYEEVMGMNPSNFLTPIAPETSTANRPVECVTWYDAVEFCNKLSEKEGLEPVYTITNRDPEIGYPIEEATVIAYFSENGYRLPTEAQWEYACRAGTTTPFNTGDNITTDQANYDGRYPYNGNPAGINRGGTTEVGTFSPNAWGLYDMHGNVSEWCWDSFGEYASGAQTDPMGASGSYQVFRGGSWENYGLELRSAYRNYLSPGDMGKWFGFRLVRPIASSGGGAVPAITTASLPDGAVGTAYSRTLAARGDTPIIWSLESGTLPAGLNLAGTTGVISGTPTTAGTSHFTVKATNATGSDTKPLSITITAVGGGVAPAITTAALLDGTEGVAYNQTLAATGDTPITWTIGSGTLPTGLNLAGTTGVISGTPTTVGTSNFTVRAANAAGIGTKPFSITIGEQKPPIEGMVWIEPGTFTMGSPTSEPNHNVNETQHEVTLTKGFYMSKYPVTQAQYEEVMRTNPSHFIDPVAPETSTANRPVECVNWYDAIVFCNKLSMNKGLTPAYSISGSTDPAVWGEVPRIGSNPTWNAVIIVADSNGYRLPTEAQWEYACRAGTTTPFNTGNNITTDQANYDGNYPYNNNPNGEYRNRTTEVGSFAPNTWDLYDMHGNVFEFCWDWFNSTYYASSPAQDPTGPDSGSYRVIRGGSYYNSAGESRSAYRGPSNGPYYGGWYNGFRLVLPAQ